MIILKVILICLFMFMKCTAEHNNTMSRSYKGSFCMENMNTDCHELLGVKSLCIANECQCVPHYHINNHNICIKDRGLKEICQSDDQCYWGPEMVDKIECSLGVCSCVAGYIPHHGNICIKYFMSSARVIEILPLFTLIMITVVSFM